MSEPNETWSNREQVIEEHLRSLYETQDALSEWVRNKDLVIPNVTQKEISEIQKYLLKMYGLISIVRDTEKV